MTNLLFLLAISGIIIWVAKITHANGVFNEKVKQFEKTNQDLVDAMARYRRIIDKVEHNQIQSKVKVEQFIKALNDARHADDYNKLLDEAFGSLVNRGDMGSK